MTSPTPEEERRRLAACFFLEMLALRMDEADALAALELALVELRLAALALPGGTVRPTVAGTAVPASTPRVTSPPAVAPVAGALSMPQPDPMFS